MSNEPGWFDRWRSGAKAHGNREGAVAAEAEQIRFSGGRMCPKGCGSVIAYQVGKPPQFSVDRHARDPKACRNHPSNRHRG